MNKIKKWENFLFESNNIEFPLKKYLYLIKTDYIDKVKIGEQDFTFDFQNKIGLDPVKVNLSIVWNKNDKNEYKGYTDIKYALMNQLESFKIKIIIEDLSIDDNKLLSVIQHELKHIYDILDDELEGNTFLKDIPIGVLKTRYRKKKDFLWFIQLVYLSLKHELDARNTMIYDRFRWLKNYDNMEIEKEFKNTYIYKSLIYLSEFDAKKFMNEFNMNELVDLTNDFIQEYGDFDKVNIDTILNFYIYWENYFKECSKIYLEKAYKVIEEIIQDTKPYMETTLSTKHIDFSEKDKIKELLVEKLGKISKSG